MTRIFFAATGKTRIGRGLRKWQTGKTYGGDMGCRRGNLAGTTRRGGIKLVDLGSSAGHVAIFILTCCPQSWSAEERRKPILPVLKRHNDLERKPSLIKLPFIRHGVGRDVPAERLQPISVPRCCQVRSPIVERQVVFHFMIQKNRS